MEMENIEMAPKIISENSPIQSSFGFIQPIIASMGAPVQRWLIAFVTQTLVATNTVSLLQVNATTLDCTTSDSPPTIPPCDATTTLFQ